MRWNKKYTIWLIFGLILIFLGRLVHFAQTPTFQNIFGIKPEYLEISNLKIKLPSEWFLMQSQQGDSCKLAGLIPCYKKEYKDIRDSYVFLIGDSGKKIMFGNCSKFKELLGKDLEKYLSDKMIPIILDEKIKAYMTKNSKYTNIWLPYQCVDIYSPDYSVDEIKAMNLEIKVVDNKST